MTRSPDLAFEKLAEVTNSVIEMERGKLNKALGAIKAAWHREGGMPEDLPAEIERRAEAYFVKFPNMTLTPTALATHWMRVLSQQQLKTPQQQALDELRREG